MKTSTKKHVFILSTIIMLVAVLGLAIYASLAWFVFAPGTDARSASVVSADISSVGMSVSIPDDLGIYRGQTGAGTCVCDICECVNKAPFSFDIDLTFGAAGVAGLRVYINFLEIDIMRNRGEADQRQLALSSTNPAVLGEFTWRIVHKDSNVAYRPDAHGFAHRMVGGTKEYLRIDSGEHEFTLSIIFLSEDSYLLWEEGLYEHEDFEFFRYSSPFYMNASFHFIIEAEVEVD